MTSRSQTSQRLYVSIVEDDRTTREALQALIENAGDFVCLGAYRSIEAALLAPHEPAAHVILLDIDLPGMPGSEGVRLLRQRFPRTEVLMLTVFADEKKVFTSICNGAVGY